MLVVNPLLADGVTDSQHRPAENLAAQRPRVKDRAHIRYAQVIQNFVCAGFQVDFYFGETGHVGVRLAVARHCIARHRQQTLARSAVADATVILLMPLGSSWPS